MGYITMLALITVMSRPYNTINYFFIPLKEITEEMLSHMSNATFDTIRKSVRPIDGKIHGICEHIETDNLPVYFRKYKAYSHEEALKLVNSKEWNLSAPIQEIRTEYSWSFVLTQFNQGSIIEAFGHTYITVFSILKFKFLVHSKRYLNDDHKWRIFNTQKLEKANEVTMLTLCYFFDLISREQYETIDKYS